jgi:Alpha-glutamyl/putrescinyl thymine pyrophosphorylase clade 2
MRVDIYTGDSDPVYWAVDRARQVWGEGWATRFSVAMLAYYHTGLACQAAEYEGEMFWNFLKMNYPTAPRGSERRHFRGENGSKALATMERFSPNPDNFFKHFTPSYAGVKRVCESSLHSFGPYFQLKICDYMDRCLDIKIQSYAGLERNLPTEPARAIALLAPLANPVTAFSFLCNEMKQKGILAAPAFDRLVGPAEVETSLCGWKTTKYKGNWFGADILDKREALKGYGDKAAAFADMMPPLVPKGTFTCVL